MGLWMSIWWTWRVTSVPFSNRIWPHARSTMDIHSSEPLKKRNSLSIVMLLAGWYMPRPNMLVVSPCDYWCNMIHYHSICWLDWIPGFLYRSGWCSFYHDVTLKDHPISILIIPYIPRGYPISSPAHRLPIRGRTSAAVSLSEAKRCRWLVTTVAPKRGVSSLREFWRGEELENVWKCVNPSQKNEDFIGFQQKSGLHHLKWDWTDWTIKHTKIWRDGRVCVPSVSITWYGLTWLWPLHGRGFSSWFHDWGKTHRQTEGEHLLQDKRDASPETRRNHNSMIL